MTRRDRDRLVVLKKAQKQSIAQRQAAAELKLSERLVDTSCRGSSTALASRVGPPH